MILNTWGHLGLNRGWLIISYPPLHWGNTTQNSVTSLKQNKRTWFTSAVNWYVLMTHYPLFFLLSLTIFSLLFSFCSLHGSLLHPFTEGSRCFRYFTIGTHGRPEANNAYAKYEIDASRTQGCLHYIVCMSLFRKISPNPYYHLTMYGITSVMILTPQLPGGLGSFKFWRCWVRFLIF